MPAWCSISQRAARARRPAVVGRGLSEGLGVTALTNAGEPRPGDWAPVTFECGVDRAHVDCGCSRVLRPNPVSAVVAIRFVHNAGDTVVLKRNSVLVEVLPLYAAYAIHGAQGLEEIVEADPCACDLKGQQGAIGSAERICLHRGSDGSSVGDLAMQARSSVRL